jgi:cold shock CspA family protein
MADSYNKKEREKKKQKRKKDKSERREQRKSEGFKTEEFMYLDENGNLVATPPDPLKKTKIKTEDIQISTPKREDEGPIDPIRFGVVKFFNTEKGYGFIIDKETGDSFFVHMDNLIDRIKDNDKVTFEIGYGPKGPIALLVKLTA